jgi:ribonuclease BN (tRNA processing enzyme)
MRISLLPFPESLGAGFPLTGVVVDEVLALDAGSLGFALSVEAQSRIEYVVLTHSHIDHIAGLPIFLDNVYQMRATPPKVLGSSETLQCLKQDLFNNRLMPDFIGLSEQLPPFLTLQQLDANTEISLGRYVLSTMAVDHTVPTLAFLLDDGQTACGFVTDTAPVPALLAKMSEQPRLKAIFLEVSFPRRLAELAAISKHLTSDDFVQAVRALPPHLTVVPIHIKPRFVREIRDEIARANLPQVRWLAAGDALQL